MNKDFKTVPLPDEKTLPPSIQTLLSSLPPLNIFRMLANVPQSFEPMILFSKSIIQHGQFDPRLREIAILRTAYLIPSEYEWHLHIPIAKGAGVKDHEMKIISTEKTVTSLDEEANFICKIADELGTNAYLKDKTFQELYIRYDVQKASELILIVSSAHMISRFLNGTRTQIEKTNPLKNTGPYD